jgi:hypothetical protein
MRLENHYDELEAGRLFTHGQLNDPISGGPLYCRIRACNGAWVEYEEIYHREDGSERIASPRRLPVQFFIEETFGGWYPNFATTGAGDTAARSAGAAGSSDSSAASLALLACSGELPRASKVGRRPLSAAWAVTFTLAT